MTKETMKFDAQVDKLFHLVIHSLYENKDIFLRELVSNASDACDKLRYRALTDDKLLKDDAELKIRISSDKDAKTLTISDNGIGMSRSELIKNLGTIARSGTQDFLAKLTGDNKKDNQLIGQFGVGFYSAFIVAGKVSVISQAAGGRTAHLWESKGDGKFTIDEIKDLPEGFTGRGTHITLHLKDDEAEYLDKFRIRHIIETYSNHVAFPIIFADDTEEELNEGKALWLRPKSEISDEEYNEFFRSVGHIAGEPWLTLHNQVEGKISYTNLLFIPSTKPFDLFHPDRATQVKLYIKRVFIAEDGLDIIPQYLRFLRGIVDSEDLPLNISRETVQNSVILHKIRKSLTKKVLSTLAKKAEKQPDEYRKFWDNFGAVIKEGLCDGLEPRDDIIEVCRFRTTSGENVSLKEYSERMKQDQKAIYYIVGDNEDAVINSPQLEGFRKRGYEVLLLADSVDQFWVNVLHQYQDIALKSVTRVDSDLDGDGDDGSGNDGDADKDYAGLVGFVKETLGDRVADVRTTSRLTDSPVCLTVPEGAMDIRMEQFLAENQQIAGRTAKIFEINPDHAIIRKLAKDITSKESFDSAADMVHLLFDQASIIEGEPLSDISAFTRRMNHLLERVG